MRTVYGLLSDADRRTSPSVMSESLDYFAQRRVDAVVLLGEVGGHMKDIVGWASKQKTELFAIPGSHEGLEWLGEMRAIQHGYPHLHNGVTEPFYDWREHRLAFVPGSELTAGGGCFYLVNEGPSGYRRMDGKAGFYFNVTELTRFVTDPRSTLIMAHMPPRQQGESATDMAYFCESELEEKVGEAVFRHRTITPGIYEEYLNQARLPDEIKPVKRENRGHEMLRRVVDVLFPSGTLKLAHGNFEESVTRACARDGRQVPENTFTGELIHNASCVDIDRAAIWTYANEKVSFEKVKLPV